MKRFAIVGATGAVGQEMLSVLSRLNLPIASLRCFASPRSLGNRILFNGEEIPLEVLSPDSIQNIDIALFSAGKDVSKTWAPLFVDRGSIVIDNSSAFRMDPGVPLVIPEINAHVLKNHRGIIASPNCSATIMLMPLAPLHRKFKIRRIIASTYQAASGAGAAMMQELREEAEAVLSGKQYERKIAPHPYAFNLFPHNSPLLPSGYVDEEIKMLEESRKILEDDSIQISATCIRVPIFRAHSESLNVEFSHPVGVQEAYAVLRNASGVEILEDRSQNRFPMPIDASGKDAVFCGRIRQDHSHPNALEFWVVGDQLLKGAALNAVQIAKCLK